MDRTINSLELVCMMGKILGREIRMGALLLLCLGAGCGEPLDNPGDKAFNIVLVTIDTLRADHLGAYGYEKIETPHMDRLAAEGVLFRKAYSPCPVTLPAHASILTAAYPMTHGVRNNGMPFTRTSLPTLAELLRVYGYATAAVIGAFVLDSGFGLDRGFDLYDDEMVYGTESVSEFFYTERRAGEVTDRAFAFLGQRGAGPFFLWIHYYDPHRVFQPPQPYASKYRDNPYDGEIAYVDEQIGKLRAKLQIEGLLEDTLLIVTGDHGEGLGDHEEKTHGFFVYDSTLHVPLIFFNPALIREGRTIDLPVSLVDIMPTVLDLLNLPAPGEMDGISLVPMMADRAGPAREPLYFETLLPYFDYGWSGLRGVRTDRLKYIAAPTPELYATGDDPGESNNLYEQEAKTAEELNHAMERLAARAAARAEAQEGGQIDPAVRKKLESLGYSSGALHATIESDPFQGPDPKERIWVESAMDQAAVLYTQGRFSEAVKTLEELMAVEPGNPKIVFHLGAMNIDLGRLDRAEAYFNQLLEIQPGSAQAWTNLGVIHEKRGQGEKAEQAFRKALEADASHAEALYNLALIHARAGKGEAAVKCLARAIEAQPNYAAAHNHLGTLLADRGDLEGALASFQKALAVNPAFGEAHFNSAQIYLMSEDFQSAARHLERAQRLGMEVPMELLNRLKEGKGP